MSVGSWIRRLLASVVGWLLVAPIVALIPKRRDWIAVIGRLDGHFADNAKYFFLQAGELTPATRCVFVTEHESVAVRIANTNREALCYPHFAALWFLARCNIAVVDESSWYKRMRRFLLIRAHVVQIWHGVGCKRIELDRWQHETGRYSWISQSPIVRLRLLAYRLTGRWKRYAAVATTSRFYRDEVFAPAFSARHFPVTGYPRNDFALSLHGINRELAWMNVDASIKRRLTEWDALGRKLVLVAPTFRDSGTMPMQLDETTLRTIDDFAENHGVEFIFKFHPSERNVDHISGEHFHVCTRESDIYPLMSRFAALVTDYSSISMDFLLVNKPLLFLIPEDDGYTLNDRQLQFDPRMMMPGPMVTDWPTLLAKLLAEWLHDTHVQERAELRRKAFDNLDQSQATFKLIALMQEQGWISSKRKPLYQDRTDAR